MSSIADDILTMLNVGQLLKITMSDPRQAVAKPNLFNRHKPEIISETDYAEEYKRKDDEEYLLLTKNIIFNKKDCLDNISDVTESMEKTFCDENLHRIYQGYNFAYRPKIDLPILSIKDKIISMINSNSVVIIRGFTGCGKTTQIPQLILDHEFKNKRNCNIIVTQPRRIAAMSIAKRVSQERDWPVGTIVGYQMGLIKNICADTRITYCTTGVLLHKLVNSKHMMNYTHVILDEVHERDEDMDFLLLMVRKFLRTNSMMVKVILMSATIDVDKFSEYFSTPLENKLLPATVIDIPGGSPYNVSIYYLDDMKNLGNIPVVSRDEPSLKYNMIEFCIRIIHIFDHIDKRSNVKNGGCNRFAVLIFLPGIQEIDDLRIVLLSEKYKDMKWEIIILHSLISTEEQENIFKKPRNDYRRIILSTNIAESSVTVPDVKYVIDFCMIKQHIVQSGSNYQSLELCWASKSNCQQRAGRAGRLMDGRVYRMIPRSFYEDVLREDNIPEIIRIPLANAVLKIKMFNMGDPKALLALALDPPNLSNLQNTILLLKEVGALLNTNGNSPFDGDLTPLGRVMASLPLDVHLTKLIVLGHIFDVLQDAIIIAASMSVKNMFNIGYYKSQSTYYEKLEWAANSASDCIACLNAFKVWRNDKNNRYIINSRVEKEWAQKNGLRVKSLREINALVSDITKKLCRFGIKEYMLPEKRTWQSHHVNHNIILKVLIAGAFYPNYFIKLPCDIARRRKGIEKTLATHDPNNTVVLHGWPLKQPGPLYARQFQEIFAHNMKLQNLDDITVSFDGSSRVYIEYNKNGRSPDNHNFVQNAIKMRHNRIPIQIDLLRENEALHHAKELRLMDMFEHVASSSSTESSNWVIKTHDKKPYPELPKSDEYRSKVTLQGPISPLEVQLVHLTTSGMLKNVHVEVMSVNSVLLDTCPNNPRGLFLVTQTIQQHAKNKEHLILRNTTLLPDTPGFASLIILIFTPYMELRRDPLGVRYTGALCGLGYDHATGLSLYPEHDLQNTFDVEITMNDLRTINKLRHWMNVAMHFVEGVNEDQHSELTINCQNQIKSAFTEVIYKTRQAQIPIFTTNFHVWNLYDETLFLEPARGTSRNCVYGLHKALDLNKKNPQLEGLIKNLLEMDSLAYEDPREVSIGPVKCQLCEKYIHGIINLRIHLSSEQHAMKQRMVDTTTQFGEDLQNLLRNMKL